MSGRQAAGKKERDIGIGADNPVQKTISNWERRKGFGVGRNRMISLGPSPLLQCQTAFLSIAMHVNAGFFDRFYREQVTLDIQWSGGLQWFVLGYF